jgi:dTDP-4-dehydrorhamnose 3,5-epimerase-like enzyme
MKRLEEVRIISLPKILDERGNLSFAQQGTQVPFEIKRTYWIYDVPGGEVRGGHSYEENNELIIALSGSFDVVIDDGVDKKVISLNRSYDGLFIPSGIWRHMENFSTNSVAFIVASTDFSENDYVRDYEYYKKKQINGDHNL